MAASITHRISGVVLALFAPFYLWLGATMLESPTGFREGVDLMHAPFGGLFLWLTGTALAYHLCNGIRFLLLDAGIGEQRARMIAVARWPFLVTAGASLLLAATLVS